MAALSASEALRIWLDAVALSPVAEAPLAQALGRIVAAAVTAPHDLPPFPRSMMDGYAVRLADAGATLPVAGAVHAGDPPSVLVSGTALAVMTGAAVPAGAEAVVQREICLVADGHVTLPERIRPQANIVPRGGEAMAGAVVIPEGVVAGPMTIAVAAAMGIERLGVVRSPRVAIRCTGAELAADGWRPGTAAIRDSNGPMLAAMCAELGVTADRATVGDDPDSIAAAIRACDADLLVLTGGVSAGDKDHVPAVLVSLGAEVLVRGVDQKPGKPLLLARLGGRLVAALPGNPLAVHWCFTGFVAPALRRLAGLPHAPRRSDGVLVATLPGSKDRPWYVPVRAVRSGGMLSVTPLPPVSSGDVVTPSTLNAYVLVPAGAPPRAPGGAVEILWGGAAAWEPG